MKKTTTLIYASTCCATLFWLNPAAAETVTDGQAALSFDAAAAPAQSTGFWDRPTLFGDMGGLRPALDEHGVTLGLQETSEYLGNVSGGIKRGATYNGLTLLTVGVDTGEAFGWPGGTFFASGLQIHGRSVPLTQGNLGSLQTVSSAEADPATRLWELWYQQSFAGGKADVKIGQQSLDQEFMVNQYGSVFVNAMFGWAALPSNDLPAGGPAYPLSSLGARLRVKASDSVTVLGGVFDGNPAGTGIGDPQKLNRSGTNFNVHDSALFIAELQYAVNPPPESPSAAQSAGLPGTYKIGVWYHSGQFADPRFDTAGVPLASPASNGAAGQHRGDYSIYALADQMVWRASPDSPQSVGVFARAMAAPGDRNQVDFSMDAGVTLKAPFKGRDNDTAGIGMGYAKLSSHARGFDRDTGFFTTPGYPVRSGETFIEATYQYQVTPWWQIQADTQYIFSPGGGVPNSTATGQTIHNETVLGVRTNITF